MNCKDTKSIDIVAFLQKVGFSGNKRGSNVWYCSPLRVEKTASFAVDTILNRWIDFGTNEKGDLLDLVKLIYKTDTLGALEKLSQNIPDQSFILRANSIHAKKEPGIIINHLQPLQNNALLQYLIERKIPLSIARRYAEEAYYTTNNKRFFSIAFRNDKNGYELRSPYYKNCTSPKYYTSFQIPGSTELNLFEGFLDAISLLAFNQAQSFSESTIVLNSLSNLQLIIPLLTNYKKINLYLDNDFSGIEAADKIKALHPCTDDKAKFLYPFFKDMNDFLTGKKLI